MNLPVGPEGAVSWLVEMLRVGTALVSSKCWWILLAFVGVRASESVGDVGVTSTVVACWSLDAEVGAVSWWLGMVEVGLVVGCFKGRWMLWAVGGTGASGTVGDEGVLWAAVICCLLDVGAGSILELARAGGGCWSR